MAADEVPSRPFGRNASSDDQQHQHQHGRPLGVEQVVAESAEDAEHQAGEKRATRVADAAEHRGGHRRKAAAEAVLGVGAAEVGGEDRAPKPAIAPATVNAIICARLGSPPIREVVSGSWETARSSRPVRVLASSQAPPRATHAAISEHQQVFQGEREGARAELDPRDEVGHGQQRQVDALVRAGRRDESEVVPPDGELEKDERDGDRGDERSQRVADGSEGTEGEALDAEVEHAACRGARDGQGEKRRRCGAAAGWPASRR